MITRIEIHGFKSFHHFAADLRPFQVLIGPNGVGKTNLFDAIVLLSNLAGDHTLDDAFGHSRGELNELFTVYLDGKSASLMTFAVEMLIGRTVADETGRARPLSTTRLRYELDIERRVEDGVEHVYVMREGLLPIAEANDKWAKDMIPARDRKNWILREKRPPFIATAAEKEQMVIYRNQDAPGGGREAISVDRIDRTVLSTANALRYPTIHAVQQEMLNWRFLQLNPFALRSHSGPQDPGSLLPDGSNLVAVLGRLSRENETALPGILRDMVKIIPDLRDLTVKPIAGRDDSLIEVQMQDGSRFSSRVISDGTLRLLSLVTLKNDPGHRGTLCFEEPENGVQPTRLKQIVDVLYALSTNFATQSSESSPLRQVLINTHSPGLLASVPADSLFYVGMKMDEQGRATRIIPVRPVLIADDQDQFYTWEQVKQYLDTDPLARKREELGL